MENRDTNVVDIIRKDEKTKMRQPGIEPGPLPWKGRILTIRPLTLVKGMTLCTYHDTS